MSAALSVIKTVKQQANEGTVELLEDLLERAKSGEVETFFAIAFRDDGTSCSFQSPSVKNMQKLGALETIKYDLLKAMDGA